MIRPGFIVVGLLLLGSGTYMVYNYPSILPKPLQPLSPFIKSTVDSGIGGAKNAIANTRNAEPKVMGMKTEATRLFEEDTKGKTVHQKAMEFTQYQYCKVIVNQYEEEARNASSSPTETPPPEEEE